MSSIIQSLQAKHLLWQANNFAVDSASVIPSGFSQLDHKLNGGWPNKGIVELQSVHFGIGELRLILPALKQLNQQQSLNPNMPHAPLVVWVAPPGRLNAQALAEAGLPLANMLVAINVSAKEAFWLSEKCLHSGCCAAVVLWCDALEPNQAKRLQLAAKDGNSLGFIIRPPSQVEQSLPVSIRMSLTPAIDGLQLYISKRLGGYPLPPFILDMRQQWPELSQAKKVDIHAKHKNNVAQLRPNANPSTHPAKKQGASL